MKTCPTCGKEYEDSMKFCQIDGTALPTEAAAADEPAFDPYATMVSMPKAPEPDAPTQEDDILDIPEVDPLKTMAISDDELQRAMSDINSGEASPASDAADDAAAAIPAPPEFISPATSEPAPPSFGDMSPPPSPFETADQSTPASYDEPATIVQSWDPPASQPVQEWTPPPAPDASWQNQQIGSNTPFQPPVVGAGGDNKTLAIVSLVLGIVSICCYIAPLTGAAALITGWMANKNIKNDPNQYGGKGLAMAGMITGGIFFALGILYYIYIIFVVGMALSGGLPR